MANFRQDLAFANRERATLDNAFYPRFCRDARFVPLERSDGSLYIQRHIHVDCIVQSKRGGSVTIEEKIVRWPGYAYTALTIETHSDLSRAPTTPIGDGWIVTSRADILLYSFLQADSSMRVWTFDLPALRAWFVPVCETFRLVDTHNGSYITRCRLVPLASIPAKIVTLRNFHCATEAV